MARFLGSWVLDCWVFGFQLCLFFIFFFIFASFFGSSHGSGEAREGTSYGGLWLIKLQKCLGRELRRR